LLRKLWILWLVRVRIVFLWLRILRPQLRFMWQRLWIVRIGLWILWSWLWFLRSRILWRFVLRRRTRLRERLRHSKRIGLQRCCSQPAGYA
jgi:hypothetical protein